MRCVKVECGGRQEKKEDDLMGVYRVTWLGHNRFRSRES